MIGKEWRRDGGGKPERGGFAAGLSRRLPPPAVSATAAAATAAARAADRLCGRWEEKRSGRLNR